MEAQTSDSKLHTYHRTPSNTTGLRKEYIKKNTKTCYRLYYNF